MLANHSDAWYVQAKDFYHVVAAQFSAFVFVCAAVLMIGAVIVGFADIRAISKRKYELGGYERSNWQNVFYGLSKGNLKTAGAIVTSGAYWWIKLVYIPVAAIILYAVFMHEHGVGFLQLCINSIDGSLIYLDGVYVIAKLAVLAIFAILLCVACLIGKYVRLRVAAKQIAKRGFLPRFVREAKNSYADEYVYADEDCD